MKKILNFIGGEFCEAASGEYLDNFCPSTGEVYSKIAKSSDVDANKAIKSARNAFSAWAETSTKTRYEILNEIADLIDENIDELAKAESLDQGKPEWLAKKVDIPRASANFRFFAGKILHDEEKAYHVESAGFHYTFKAPVGVCGSISPWNLPLYLLTWKIAPAIAFGNTIVCKPSELTPMTAFLLAELIKKSRLPKGVVNIVNGLGAEVGEAIVSHPDVPLITFTGGTKTAESIIKSSAPYFKKLSLELGGKNANLIFEDADLEKAIEGSVRAAFTNQGEICLCGSRLLVHESLKESFTTKFVEKVSNLKVGDPSDEANFMGALVSKDHLEKVEGYIDLAKKLGGEILSGGTRVELQGRCKGGYFLRPTVISGLDEKSELFQEEIFGPVVTINYFKDDEEALRLANCTKYGLAASLWTENGKRAHNIAKRIDGGLVWINSWMQRDLRVPFGGMKASGVGREGGESSKEFYTENKSIYMDLT